MKLDVFSVHFQSMGLGKKGSLCKGGKKAKQRFTITFIANAAGEKESAIVIWKAEKPRCFKGVDMSKLPVQYFSQPNAWMTGEILDKVLTRLNHRPINGQCWMPSS